ncbi:MAG: zinc ribbon domain-containing protein [Promethearchaeota archaeon]
MADNEDRLIRLAKKRFSEIIGDGFKLFGKNYKTLILPLALFQVILIILNIFLLTDLSLHVRSLDISEIIDKSLENETLSESDINKLFSFLLLNLALLFFQNLIGALVITIAMCSVSNYIYQRQMGKDIKFGQSFKSAFNKKIFFPILIIGILLPLGGLIIFLFIPAIIIFGFFIFLVFTYNMEDVQKPVSEARAIAKGSFWKIIGVFIINFIIIFLISIIYDLILDFILYVNVEDFSSIYDSWLNPETRNYSMLILYQILNNLIDIIFAPLFICFLTSLFSTSKAKKDLGYQYETRYSPVREVYQEPHSRFIQSTQELEDVKSSMTSPRMQTEKQFYCPFCGYLIKTPKKFCPNCGENLSFIKEE